ncbi:hypothetical protein BHE74_00053210 [Ensete ventricosum]|uniref:Uncharacterized protein n=1 Tax=Ensete ventricosum TaxID=4639 RepID=A0A444D742_ENSVE|nr:hypothetical protein B296_00028131 [Ensete ventricosum]RWV93917.1 hypothetical protein GW17_00043591 [Ensete ventricosum]RWW41317.1 hypothetical protein BHE74_00053210 [Ensete ventricosum]RZS03060.1 hypothetical protein BHM03_00033212 [Ensete ventricosum]
MRAEPHHTYSVLRTQPRFHGANGRGCRRADSRRRFPTAVSCHSLFAADAAPAHIVVSRTNRICSAPQLIRGGGEEEEEAEAFASLLCLGCGSRTEEEKQHKCMCKLEMRETNPRRRWGPAEIEWGIAL